MTTTKLHVARDTIECEFAFMATMTPSDLAAVLRRARELLPQVTADLHLGQFAEFDICEAAPDYELPTGYADDDIVYGYKPPPGKYSYAEPTTCKWSDAVADERARDVASQPAPAHAPGDAAERPE